MAQNFNWGINGAEGIWRSDDSGNLWNRISNIPSPFLFTNIFYAAGNLFFSGVDSSNISGTYYSSDNGLTWKFLNNIFFINFLYLGNGIILGVT